MGQDRKRGAGKQKHNHRERRVRIFQRQACSLVRFGVFDGTGGFLVRELRDFSFVLNRIVHLPVPSESVSWRGKFSKMVAADFFFAQIERMVPDAEHRSEQGQKRPAEESAKPGELLRLSVTEWVAPNPNQNQLFCSQIFEDHGLDVCARFYSAPFEISTLEGAQVRANCLLLA